MRPFVAVLRRELAEHRLLLAGACLVSLFPLLLPFVPGVAQAYGDPAELRGGAALILAGLLSALLAATLGAFVLARDLSEGRLSFYFARPMPGAAIWAGKILAVFAVAVAAGVVILVPAWLLGDLRNVDGLWGWVPPHVDDSVNGTGTPGTAVLGAALWAALLLALLLGAHALSCMARSRNAWLLLDLAAAVGIAGLVMATGHRLVDQGAFFVAQLLLAAFLALLVVALLGASLAQILRGRTDLHSGHRWLSCVLWSVLLGSGVVLASYSEWILSARPKDLRQVIAARSAPVGEWVYLFGETSPARLFHSPSFLLEGTSGRSVSLPPYWVAQRVQFSRDGRWAAWVETSARKVALVRVDLTSHELRPLRHALPSAVRGLALSPDGRRIAIRLLDRLLVEETESGRLLASVPLLPGSNDISLIFPESERLLLLRSGMSVTTGSTAVEELDLATSRLSHLSTLPAKVWELEGLSPDGRRLLLQAGSGYLVVDLATGRPLAELRSAGQVSPPGPATFLADGRIVLSRWRRTGTEMALYDPDGSRLLRTFDWPHHRTVAVQGELPSGELIVALGTRRYAGPEDRLEMAVLDLDRGTARPLGHSLKPLWHAGERPLSNRPGLLLRAQNELVRLDPKTGELQTILDLD